MEGRLCTPKLNQKASSGTNRNFLSGLLSRLVDQVMISFAEESTKIGLKVNLLT